MQLDILIIVSQGEHTGQLCSMLDNEGISTILTSNLQTAFECLKKHISDFMLLDFGLVGALPFLEKVIDTFCDPPYIIAADYYPCSMAHAEVLDLGADTCLEKPLDVKEVLSVIKAVLRRTKRLPLSKPIQTVPQIKCSTLMIDPMRRSVSIDEKSVELTVKEFDILHFLASYPGVVFSKEQIYERVWDEDYQFSTTSVSDHISSLRKKLGLSPQDGRYIQTVYGAGYRFVEPK